MCIGRYKPEYNKAKKAVNAINGYHKHVPIDAIDAALREHGFKMVNEDESDFCAVFCGREGRTAICVMHTQSRTPVGSFVVLSWYKLTTQYEIVVYLS